MLQSPEERACTRPMKTKEQLNIEARAFLEQYFEETGQSGFKERGAIPTGAWVDYFGKP